MRNCLVTKLKSSVDNQNLPVLGEAVLSFALTPSSRLSSDNFKTVDNKPLKIHIIDDGIKFGTAYGQSSIVDDGTYKNCILVPDRSGNNGVSLTDNSGTLIPNTTVVSFKVKSKYDFIKLGGNTFWRGTINLDDYLYCTNLEDIYCSPGASYAQAYGDIANLRNLVKVTEIRLDAQRNIYGDINNLGKLILLEDIYFAKSSLVTEQKIVGNFKDLVISQCNNGRKTNTSGIVVHALKNTLVPFGSVLTPTCSSDSANAYLKWSSTQSNLSDLKIALEITSENKVYVIGYTQAQAEEAYPVATWTIEYAD